MSLTTLLNQDMVAINSSAKNKTEILKTIAELASKNTLASGTSAEEIFEGLKNREQLGTTGFGNGIAIPHCRLPNIKDFILGIITIPETIDFDAIDNNPVKLAVFLIAPEDQANRHIRLLSSISQVLRMPGAIDSIIAQTDLTAIRETFLKYAVNDIDDSPQEGKNLFYIIIHNENLFHEILPILSTLTGSVEFIIESKSINDYVTSIPLFAGIMNDDYRSFSKVIVATVKKKMTNDTIRRIENVTGPLDNNSEVMIIVQDIVYASNNSN